MNSAYTTCLATFFLALHLTNRETYRFYECISLGGAGKSEVCGNSRDGVIKQMTVLQSLEVQGVGSEVWRRSKIQTP